MFGLSRCKLGWHKWLFHGGITTGLHECERCGKVERFMRPMVCPPCPPLLSWETNPTIQAVVGRAWDVVNEGSHRSGEFLSNVVQLSHAQRIDDLRFALRAYAKARRAQEQGDEHGSDSRSDS